MDRELTEYDHAAALGVAQAQLYLLTAEVESAIRMLADSPTAAMVELVLPNLGRAADQAKQVSDRITNQQHEPIETALARFNALLEAVS